MRNLLRDLKANLLDNQDFRKELEKILLDPALSAELRSELSALDIWQDAQAMGMAFRVCIGRIRMGIQMLSGLSMTLLVRQVSGASSLQRSPGTINKLQKHRDF